MTRSNPWNVQLDFQLQEGRGKPVQTLDKFRGAPNSSNIGKPSWPGFHVSTMNYSAPETLPNKNLQTADKPKEIKVRSIHVGPKKAETSQTTKLLPSQFLFFKQTKKHHNSSKDMGVFTGSTDKCTYSG